MTDTDPQTAAFYRSLLMARSLEERFLMGIRLCEVARATVLASMPGNLSTVERKVAILRRYYSADFSDETLEKIAASIRSSG